MRQIVGIALFVLGAGLWLCHWEGIAARTPDGANELRWVRTVDGWEPSDSWHAAEIRPPSLHPVVLACGQGMFSMFALAAFPTLRNARKNSTKSPR